MKNIVGGPSTESFADLKYNYIQWLECYRLELSDEICKMWPMDFGMIFLKIPLNPTLKFFYINYLPYITILLFVFTITFLLLETYGIITLELHQENEIKLLQKIPHHHYITNTVVRSHHILSNQMITPNMHHLSLVLLYN